MKNGSRLLSLSSMRLASWLAVCAILLHAFTPFAHVLAGSQTMDGVFCGTLTPTAKLALAKLPDSGSTLLKLTQHECSLCQQADQSIAFATDPVRGLIALNVPHIEFAVPVFIPRSRLKLAAAPPPSHAPPFPV